MSRKPDREPAQIIVIPSAPRYVTGIERLMAEVYQVNPADYEDVITASKALCHLSVFPEGQFVAIDTATDEVIGMTTSMQIHFNPDQPFVESWLTTTDYG